MAEDKAQEQAEQDKPYLQLYVAPYSDYETEDGLKLTNPTGDWHHVYVKKTTNPAQPIDVSCGEVAGYEL